MNPDQFRAILLAQAEVVEGSHRGHADFRIKNRVIASLGYPDAEWGMLKLSPEQQAILVESEKNVFKPAPGSWGRNGNTLVRLAYIDDTTALSAIRMACGNAAP